MSANPFVGTSQRRVLHGGDRSSQLCNSPWWAECGRELPRVSQAGRRLQLDKKQLPAGLQREIALVCASDKKPKSTDAGTANQSSDKKVKNDKKEKDKKDKKEKTEKTSEKKEKKEKSEKKDKK